MKLRRLPGIALTDDEREAYDSLRGVADTVLDSGKRGSELDDEFYKVGAELVVQHGIRGLGSRVLSHALLKAGAHPGAEGVVTSEVAAYHLGTIIKNVAEIAETGAPSQPNINN